MDTEINSKPDDDMAKQDYATIEINVQSLNDHERNVDLTHSQTSWFSRQLLKIGIDLNSVRTQLIVYALGIFIFYLWYGIIQENIIFLKFLYLRNCGRFRLGSIPAQTSTRVLLGCFFGVFFCYLFFGFCQEKITRGDYDGEKFVFPEALVFVQCVLNAVFAKAILKYVTKPPQDNTSTWLYVSCSFCYMGAMVASNQALQYINYPTQVLGKSCKPIPVMLLGIILAKKRYPVAKFICVILIVLGVAMFMYKENKAGVSNKDFSFGYGEILLLVSLTLDGLTGASQDRMRTFYGTNQHHMMYNVNFWSCIMLFISLCVNGNGLRFIQFLGRHNSVMFDLLLFSITSALGQHFIFLTVVKFGPLTCSIITTTRKFFTILASVILFQNPLTNMQWAGALCVFSGLAADAKYGKAVKKEEKKSEK